MAIYKYTLLKYFKAKSTWIIVVLGFIIAGLLGGILPWSLYNVDADVDGTGYSQLLIGSVVGMTSMLAVFTSIFAGYKSATMYKDEVEDGTFLVILSKPQSRFKIIITKWFALQTINILYLLFLVLSYGIINVINDTFPQSAPENISSFSSQAVKIMWSMFAVIFVTSLIFSSIGLLISTRTGTSASIGISTSLGVIIPITGLLQTFTQGSEYEKLSNGSFELTYTTNSAIFGEGTSSDNLEALYSYLTDKDHGLLNMAFKTSETDTYRTWSYLDLNYQIGQLSSYASETVITSEFKDIIGATQSGERGGSPFSDTSRSILAKDNIIGDLSSDSSKKDEAQDFFSQVVYDTMTLANNYSVELNSLLQNLTMIVALNPGSPDLTLPTDSEIDDQVINISVIVDGNGVPSLDADNPRNTTLGSMKAIYEDLFTLVESFALDSGVILETILDSEYIITFAKDNQVNDESKGDTVISDQNGTGADIVLLDGTEDHKLFSYMSNLVTAGKGYINMTDKTPYIKKESVLIAYILIALALVPLSIFIVKKQDFR